MIIQKYLPINTLRRSGLKLLGVKFITAHDSGNINSTAMQNVDYFIKSANEIQASAHTFIDDKDIIECIPQTEKAYHVRRAVEVDNSIFGVDAIDCSLGIELCSFSDIERSKLAYMAYVDYIKGLCAKYNLNPSVSVIGHYRLDPTRRNDPITAFTLIGKTWSDFIKDLSPQPLIKTTAEKKAEIIKLINEL